MSDMNNINLQEHNEKVVAAVVWLLDRNAPMKSLGFYLSDAAMARLREIRAELHPNENWTRANGLSCGCKRCARKSRTAKRQPRKRVAA